MKGLKQCYLLLTLVVLVVGVGIFFWVKSYQQSQLKAYGQEFSHGYYISPVKVKAYQHIEDKQAIAIDWELTTDRREDKVIRTYNPDTIENPVYSGKRYIVRESAKLRYNPLISKDDIPSTQEDEYWTVNIYDTQKMSKTPRTIDLLRDVQADTNLWVQGPVGVYTKDGKEYLMISLFDFDGKKRFKAINLETEKVYPAPFHKGDSGIIFEDGFKLLYPSWNKDILMRFDLEDKFLNQNLVLSDNSVTLENGKKLPASSNQWPLRKDYPKQFRFFESGAVVYILDDNYMGGESLLSLFVPDKADLYKGITLSSEDTIDGQEHIINSYEELLQYYKDSEE